MKHNKLKLLRNFTDKRLSLLVQIESICRKEIRYGSNFRVERFVGKEENAGSVFSSFRAMSSNTVKPVLETTCIKRTPALRDHCSDTATVLKSTS